MEAELLAIEFVHNYQVRLFQY